MQVNQCTTGCFTEFGVKQGDIYDVNDLDLQIKASSLGVRVDETVGIFLGIC